MQASSPPPPSLKITVFSFLFKKLRNVLKRMKKQKMLDIETWRILHMYSLLISISNQVFWRGIFRGAGGSKEMWNLNSYNLVWVNLTTTILEQGINLVCRQKKFLVWNWSFLIWFLYILQRDTFQVNCVLNKLCVVEFGNSFTRSEGN